MNTLPAPLPSIIPQFAISKSLITRGVMTPRMFVFQFYLCLGTNGTFAYERHSHKMQNANLHPSNTIQPRQL